MKQLNVSANNISSSAMMIKRRTLWVVTCGLLVVLSAVYAASGYQRLTKALYGVLNPCFFCLQCEIADGDAIVVENNPANLTSSKLYPWQAAPAVLYFVVSEALDNEPIEIAINFPIKETILVVSSDKRVTFKLKISDEYKSFGPRLTQIYVNGPLKNSIDLDTTVFNPTIKYFCDESQCDNPAIRVTNGYYWSSGGKSLQSQMESYVGRTFTSFVGCERARFFKLANDLNRDGCEPLSGGAIAGIVVGVTVPVLACCCGIILGLIRVCISCIGK
ncbi:predicted protein [Naegleria gruberi]|uniref:Predicted protein n=1 Tax=Naegleria gruberi TaxID=5762 RepID=D2UZV3_NAEGR|nr:uncharacterized protein NAEGRDRAFT_62074 [Naegleria gruberi]EFC50228.1 predicted protein [Naegleria gruberi]|eukprot:XP_002682972.1 predicted protein [Naegleria gruberi strain NEG-M]